MVLAVTGACLIAVATWVLLSGAWLTGVAVRALLDDHTWHGNEVVLSVSRVGDLVGREVAKLAPRGNVHERIEPWYDVPHGERAETQGMAPTRAGDSLGAETAVALPYADDVFDVVISTLPIHRVAGADRRRRIIAELWRVTKPGGEILLFDTSCTGEYLQQFGTLGAGETIRSGPIVLQGRPGWHLRAPKPIAAWC